MALLDSLKRNKSIPAFEVGRRSQDNPVEEYPIEDIVVRIAAAQEALDEKVHAFLARVNGDDRIVANFNANEEWRCWLEQDRESSRLLFDPDLTGFDDEAYDCFKKTYASELAVLLKENDAIDKMAQALDEYRLFKTSLFNVFNNGNQLPLQIYLEQVFRDAPKYGMTVTRHSKEDMDLLVSFDPLGSINRGNAFFSYDLYLRFNYNHKAECHVFSVCMMDATSSDIMYSGPVDLPITGAFAKFTKDADVYFMDNVDSPFYQQSLKAHRKKEKARFGIPSDYFEAFFVDSKKLVDFSEKSYQYGNSKIFIPKSQMAFAGEKVYMKPWLYAKLKRRVEQFEAFLAKREQETSLDDKVASAAAQGTAVQPSMNEKDFNRDLKERS